MIEKSADPSVSPDATRQTPERELLRRFVEKLEVILPKVDSIIAFNTIRSGFQYDGPNLVEEMRDAKELLSASGAPQTPEKERLFPVQKGPAIPWRLIAPFEQQAKANHDQDLETLARRGGLGCEEALAVLHGQTISERYPGWKFPPNQQLVDELLDLIRLREARPLPSSASPLTTCPVCGLTYIQDVTTECPLCAAQAAMLAISEFKVGAPSAPPDDDDVFHHEDPQHTVDVIARMLGWMNTPPLSTLEMSINALKARVGAPRAETPPQKQEPEERDTRVDGSAASSPTGSTASKD